MFTPFGFKANTDPKRQRLSNVRIPVQMQRDLNFQAAAKNAVLDPIETAQDLLSPEFVSAQEDEYITRDQANEEYGIDGVLDFHETLGASIRGGLVSRNAAQKESTKRQEQLAIEEVLADGQVSNNLGEQAQVLLAGFTRSMIAGESAATLGMLGAFKGGRALLTGFRAIRNPYVRTVARAGIDGAAGNLITAPFVAQNYEALGQDYTVQDAALDVGAGLVLGGGLGTLGAVLKSRQASKLRTAIAAGVSERKTMMQVLIDASDDAAAKINSERTQLKEEGLLLINEIAETFRVKGEELSDSLASSLTRLVDIQQIDTKLEKNIFTNDLILRNDLRLLNPEQQNQLRFKAAIEPLFNTRDTIDFEKIIELSESGKTGLNKKNLNKLINKLPTGLRELVGNIVGSSNKTVSLRKFFEQVGDSTSLGRLISKQGRKVSLPAAVKKKIMRVLGKEGDINLRTELSLREAIELHEAIQLDRKINVDESLSGTDHLRLVEKLQKDLKGKASQYVKSFDDFSRAVGDLIDRVVGKYDLDGLTLTELYKLRGERRAGVLDLLRVIQEANPTKAQLRGLFKGNKKSMREIYQQGKFNNDVKARFTEQQALKNIEEHFQQQLETGPTTKIPAPTENLTPLGKSIQDKVEIEGINPELQKQIEYDKAQVPEEKIKDLEEGIKIEKQAIDDEFNAYEAIIRCAING